MIKVGTSVVYRPNGPRPFYGVVIAITDSIARVVGPRVAKLRANEARDIAVRELHEVAAPPLALSVGQRTKIYGHDVEVLARDIEARTSDMVATIDRESGVRFVRKWRVPDWRVRVDR